MSSVPRQCLLGFGRERAHAGQKSLQSAAGIVTVQDILCYKWISQSEDRHRETQRKRSQGVLLRASHILPGPKG